MIRACGYCRISKEKEKRDLSVALQKERIISYAKSKGWEVVKFYVDKGFSGGSLNRKGFTKLMSELDNYNAVIVYKLDRFARNLGDLLNTLKLLQEKGIIFVSTTEQFDTSTAMGKFGLQLFGAVAELERNIVSERMQDLMESRREKGIVHNKPPYGYEFKNGMLVPDENAVKVKAIFEKRSKGIGVTQLSREYGLSRNAIYYILYNRVYLGEVKIDGKWVKGGHEPIISEKLFERVHSNSSEKVPMRGT